MIDTQFRIIPNILGTGPLSGFDLIAEHCSAAAKERNQFLGQSI